MAAAAVTIAEVARLLDAQIIGDDSLLIEGLGSLSTARRGQISHLSSASYKPHLAQTQATAVILTSADAAGCPCVALVVDNPYLAFAKVSQLFVPKESLPLGIASTASVGARCEIDATAHIGPNVVIGDDTVIGPGVKVFANTTLGDRCRLDAGVILRANVSIYNDVSIGARSIIHSGAVIGADGFGFAPDAQGHLQPIAQLGGVVIGMDVVVGACSTIDCGAIEATVVEDGVKIDNQVQIGHNCHIGAHSLLCGCVGLAGSTRVGRHCVFAGGAGAGGDKPVEICDGVTVTARTVVTQSVEQPGVYSGTILFHDHSRWRRNALRFASLDELFKRVKKLETRFK